MSDIEEDSELDDILNILEQDYKEIESSLKLLDEANDWLFLLEDIANDAAEQFIANMDSLSIVFDIIKNNEKNNSFLVGTIWSGVLAAYEGFVHDLLDQLLKHEKYKNLALTEINNLTDKDKNHLRIGKKHIITEQKLRELFNKATLHDPNQIVRLAKILFHLQLPEINEDYVHEALKIRNAYTHYNGLNNGTKISLTIERLEAFHANIDLIVGDFIDGIKAHADNFFKQKIT